MVGLDSEYLMALARLKTVENRATLAETITDLFTGRGEFLTDVERASMSAMLRRIIGDIEAAIRTALCDVLEGRPDVPRETADQLRSGEVVYALLADSPALQAEDLIEVVRHRYLEYRLSRALRERAAEAVARERFHEDNGPRVTEILLHSPSADIARRAMEYLVDQSRGVELGHEPAVRLSELGPDLARRLSFLVSAALRQHVVQELPLDEMVVDELMEGVVSAQVRHGANGDDRDIADRLADDLAEAHMIDAQILVASLAQGEVSLFIALFARATGLRRRLAQRLLFEPGGEGLAIACKAIAMPPDLFARIFSLSRVARPVLPAQVRIDAKKALAFYDLLNAEQAAHVVRKWRLSPDYAAAVRGFQLRLTAIR